MKLFGKEMIPHEEESKTGLCRKEMVPERRRSGINKTRSSSTASPYPLPFALLQTAERMGGGHAVFVTRKILTRSDVNVSLNRFFIPKSEVLLEVLSEEERRAVEGGGGVDVGVVDTRGKKHRMRLKKWASLNKIVLNSGWRKLVEDNKLMPKVDCVELWSFRADSKLCFGLNIKSDNTINNSDKRSCV